MILRDANIFFDTKGNSVMKINESADLCFQSASSMMLEAPSIIAKKCRIQADFIGAYTVINDNVQIKFTESIGRFCTIDDDCRIGLGIHPDTAISTSDFFYAESRWRPVINGAKYNDFEKNRERILANVDAFKKGKITIGNDVWIGQGVIILNGISIGDGAIIEAGALVTENVEPYTIVGGVPAKLVRKRFEEPIIEEMLKLQWWNYGAEIIAGLDVSKVTWRLLGKIEERISTGQYPQKQFPMFLVESATGKISKIEEGKKDIIYDLKEETISRGGVSGIAEYNCDNHILRCNGWFLPTTAYDEIKMYSNHHLLGKARLHVLRPDVYNNFPEYGQMRSGWEYSAAHDLRILGEDILVECSKNGKTVHCVKNKIEYISLAKILKGHINLSNYVFSESEEVRIVASSAEELEYFKSLFGEFYCISDMENCKNIIICDWNWKEECSVYTQKDKRAIPFWLYILFENNLLIYKNLKNTASVLHINEAELLGELKQICNRQILMVYGNCQILSINPMLVTSQRIRDKYIVISLPPVHETKDPERTRGFRIDFLGKIDVLIYQHVSNENKFSPKLASAEILKGLKRSARKVCIPNVYFTGYWPQFCGNPHNPVIPELNNTPFPYGDCNIQEMHGTYTAKEITCILGKEDFYSPQQCKENVEKSLSELRRREGICDIRISDYIEENYMKQRLFYTVNHPVNHVLRILMERVFDFLNEEYADMNESAAWENKGREIPIYLSVEKGLKLRFHQGKFYWWNELQKEPSDLLEYVRAYLKYCYKIDD